VRPGIALLGIKNPMAGPLRSQSFPGFHVWRGDRHRRVCGPGRTRQEEAEAAITRAIGEMGSLTGASTLKPAAALSNAIACASRFSTAIPANVPAAGRELARQPAACILMCGASVGSGDENKKSAVISTY
jgi:hypothetical protein